MSQEANTLGDAIRQIRESLKRTQDQFAQDLGFKRGPTVSDWERNESVPDRGVLDRIAGLAGKSYAEVFARFEGVPRPQPNGNGSEAPEFVRPEWVPKLLAKVLELPDLSPDDRARLMAQVNAAAVHFWAISAEWAGGQRGIAVQRVAQANQAAEESARTRAQALRGEGAGDATARDERDRRIARSILTEIREEERQQAERAAGQSGGSERAAS